MNSRNRILQSIFLAIYLIGSISFVQAQPNYPRDAKDAQLITSDVAHFIEAHQQLQSGADTLGILNNTYFSKASPGMKEYIAKHNLTPELLKAAIAADPEKYNSIADFHGKVSDIEPQIKDALVKFSEVLPNAMYPPTYLIVGANRGIAQASRYGQLVTITRLQNDPAKLIKMIVHELSHFQQAMTIGPQNYGSLYSQENNMLDLCLREGGAEFITWLVLEDITQSPSLKYYETHSKELDQRFLTDLENQDPSYWLWESIGKDREQQLLGYVMGFRICQSYYEGSTDKEKALQDILGISQAQEFLDNSDYFK